MPSTLDRRRFLRTGGPAVLAGFAGCVPSGGPGDQSGPSTPTPPPPPRNGTPPATGTAADAPAGPEPYPDRPDEVTRETVVDYVRAFEHARTTNVLHEPDVETIALDCRAGYDVAGDGGHYALATCTGYANYADGVHADWGQRPALYFVAPDRTVRVEDLDDRHFDCRDVFAASNPGGNFAAVCEGGDASYLVYNLHHERRTLSVTVEFLGTFRTRLALGRTYRLAPASGVKQGSVTYRRGVYRLTAALEDGPATTYRWPLRSEPTYADPPVAALVTPTGGVTVRRLPMPALD